MFGKIIYVYKGLGTTKLTYAQLRGCLSQYFPSCSVIGISGEEIIRGKWRDNALMMCFGGGYDSGFMKDVTISGINQIKEYIHNGGKYLGICAGAYFACNKIRFDEDGPLEIIEDRYIKLFKGTAVGPILKKFEYDSEAGSCSPSIYSQTNESPNTINVYFNGGCYFDSENWDNTTLRYRYSENHLPAIIECSLGLGKGILSGVHFEFDPDLLLKYEDSQATKEIYPELLKNNEKRLSLCDQLFHSLLD